MKAINYKSNVDSAIRIYVDIKSCNDCPYQKNRIDEIYSPACQIEGKIIRTKDFIDEKIKVPKWCPFCKNAQSEGE